MGEVSTLSYPEKHHQVAQPKQRVLLRARVWLLLSRPNGLKHPAWRPRQRSPQGVKGLRKGLLKGREQRSWSIPCYAICTF